MPDLTEIEESLRKIREQVPEITAGVQDLIGESEIDTALAPPIDSGVSGIVAAGNGALTGAQGQLDSVQKLIAQLTKQSEEAAKRATDAQKSWTGLIKKRQDVTSEQKPIEEITREALAEFGYTSESVAKVQGWMGQLTTYNQQIANLEARKQASLDRIESRPGIDLAFMTREQNESAKKYNREIATKAAQAGVVSQQILMERNLWTDARAVTSQIVNAATYDQQQVVADIEWGLSTYKDLYDMATKEEQTAWNKAYTISKDELDKQQTDMTNKLNLMTDAASKGVNLGWNIDYMKTKSLEELTAEYSKGVAGAEGIGTGFTDTQLLKLEQAGLSNATREEQLNHLFGDEGEDEEFTLFEEFVSDNIQESYASLFSACQRDSNLSDSECRGILESAGVRKGKEATQGLSEDNMKDIAKAVVKKSKSTDEAKRLINAGTIRVKGRNINLSQEQIDKIIAEIDRQFPKGKRGFFDIFGEEARKKFKRGF